MHSEYIILIHGKLPSAIAFVFCFFMQQFGLIYFKDPAFTECVQDPERNFPRGAFYCSQLDLSQLGRLNRPQLYLQYALFF